MFEEREDFRKDHVRKGDKLKGKETAKNISSQMKKQLLRLCKADNDVVVKGSWCKRGKQRHVLTSSVSVSVRTSDRPRNFHAWALHTRLHAYTCSSERTM